MIVTNNTNYLSICSELQHFTAKHRNFAQNTRTRKNGKTIVMKKSLKLRDFEQINYISFLSLCISVGCNVFVVKVVVIALWEYLNSIVYWISFFFLQFSDLTLVVALAFVALSFTNGAPQMRRHRRHWFDDPFHPDKIPWKDSCGVRNDTMGSPIIHRNRTVSEKKPQIYWMI